MQGGAHNVEITTEADQMEALICITSLLCALKALFQL